MYDARVEADSITQYGERLTTVVFTLPRINLAELNTHRALSKSSASSRAVPVATQIKRLREDSFEPVYWGKNQKGMQADQELTPHEIADALAIWHEMKENAISGSERLMNLGVHKQIASRPMEAWMWHTVIVTGTEWSNWDHLRVNKNAQPEIRRAAEMVLEMRNASKPKLLSAEEWHLPFAPAGDAEKMAYSMEERVKMSVGRAARVSYNNHDGTSDPTADVRLATGLLTNGHMAPWEHSARPMTQIERGMFGRHRIFAGPGSTGLEPNWTHGEMQYFCGNFNGWIQARKLVYGEQDILAFER